MPLVAADTTAGFAIGIWWAPSTQQVVHSERERGKRGGSESFTATDTRDLLINAIARLGVAFEHLRLHIKEPGFEDARYGVQREPGIALVIECAIDNIDHEENVRGYRMSDLPRMRA
jgi:hypothetical protein